MGSAGHADSGPASGSTPASGEPATRLVFSDLDGTLLDARSYSWQPARPALRALQATGGLLIPATSKTAAEVEALSRRLRQVVSLGPVIVENGAAVHGPPGAPDPEGARPGEDGGWELVLGPGRAEVMEGLATLRREYGDGVIGFTEMSQARARRETGLEGAALAAARSRCHTEPFLAPEADLEDLRALVAHRGLDVTRGGRFFHLGGDGIDKGTAARRVLSAYRKAGLAGPTVGLGDSLNDRELLSLVDRAVLIPGPDGRYDADLMNLRPDLLLAPQPGPAGWNAAIRQILEERSDDDPEAPA